jgi:hypothetical protein
MQGCDKHDKHVFCVHIEIKLSRGCKQSNLLNDYVHKHKMDSFR